MPIPLIASTFAGGLAALVSQTGPPDVTDPVSWFTSLGVAGIVAFVVWMWQRDTAKQRDRAQKSWEELNPVLSSVLEAIRQSTEAHKASIEAQKSTIDAIGNIPSVETWTRIKLALEYVEDSRKKSDRGEQ